MNNNDPGFHVRLNTAITAGAVDFPCRMYDDGGEKVRQLEHITHH